MTGRGKHLLPKTRKNKECKAASGKNFLKFRFFEKAKKSCQTAMGQSSDSRHSRQTVVMQLSGSSQAVVRQSLGSGQAVVR